MDDAMKRRLVVQYDTESADMDLIISFKVQCAKRGIQINTAVKEAIRQWLDSGDGKKGNEKWND
jgi:hypothetical protein